MGKKKYFGEVDFILLTVIVMLVFIGVSAVYSASYNVALFRYDNAEHYLIRQGIFACMGIFCMLVLMRIDYHLYKKWSGKLIIVTIILLIIVLFSAPVNGARRWINLGFTTIQPSEIAKYVVVLVLAKILENNSDKMDKLTNIARFMIIPIIFAVLVLAEKNLSITAVIVGVSFIMLFVNGLKWMHIFSLGGTLVGLGAAAAILEPYRMARVTSFLNPWQDPQGSGYQLIQSLYALASGSILGVGIGNSRQKMMYIPEPHNDFIFAIIGEELGLIGCIFIISLYLILIYRGFKVALNAKDTYGSLVAIGITSVIAVQAIINIAVVSGSMPVTGVPLPFISAGGTSLVLNLMGMGILLNVSRQNRMKN